METWIVVTIESDSRGLETTVRSEFADRESANREFRSMVAGVPAIYYAAVFHRLSPRHHAIKIESYCR